MNVFPNCGCSFLRGTCLTLFLAGAISAFGPAALEVDYSFDWLSHPELGSPNALNRERACMAEMTLTNHWPQFRGPHGSGVAADSDPPICFGPATNVFWKTERPGFRRGFSTPIVWRSPILGAGLLYVGGWTPGAAGATFPPFQTFLDQADKNKDGQLSRDEAPPGAAQQHFLYMDANKDGQLTIEEYDAIAAIFGRSQNAFLAIRPGGTGDVTQTHVAWKQTRGLPYVPSPLFYQDRVYVVKNGGIASCFNATHGTALYREERRAKTLALGRR